MYKELAPYSRLLLCLALSAGLHGVALSPWLQSSPRAQSARTPLQVALVDAGPERLTEAAPGLPAEPAKRPPAAVKPPVPTRSKPLPQSAEIVPLDEPGAAAKAVAKEPAEAARQQQATREMVCMAPQEIVGPAAAQDLLAIAGPLSAQPPVAAGQTQEAAGAGAVGGALERLEAIPNYRSNPLPEYPYLARQRRWQGVVWLLVEVSAAGRVDDLTVERSSGHRVLDRAAQRAVRRWRFSPATRLGLPVDSRVRVPVRFKLERG
jgi:protein TonB